MTIPVAIPTRMNHRRPFVDGERFSLQVHLFAGEQMKMLLNRRVLITGGGSGIGARTARAIVDRGGKVAVFDIEGDAAQRTAESLGAIQSLSFQGDVTDPEAIEGVLDAMCEVWGGIDDLVNNVGIYDHGSLLELTVSQWRRVFDVNFMAPVAVSCAAVRRMRPGSSIVNVSSVLGRTNVGTRTRSLLCL